jgi:hypothetical protein
MTNRSHQHRLSSRSMGIYIVIWMLNLAFLSMQVFAYDNNLTEQQKNRIHRHVACGNKCTRSRSVGAIDDQSYSILLHSTKLQQRWWRHLHRGGVRVVRHFVAVYRSFVVSTICCCQPRTRKDAIFKETDSEAQFVVMAIWR